MSKSLARVQKVLAEHGLTPTIQQTGAARTAREAADAVGCTLDQIAKSIIFAVAGGPEVVLFITAGGNSVDSTRASHIVGSPLGKADAGLIRKQTGFAIGGVAPIGHLQPIRAFMDPRLIDFATIWAAAGTPQHVFSISPQEILKISRAQLYDFTSDNRLM